jgi:ketosteroid isomerase-like protein
MSRENVATARSFVAAYNREDFEAALRLGTADLVLDFSRALGPYRGVYPRDRILGFLEELNSTFESVRFEPRDFIDAGDRVVMPMTIRFRGRDGIEVKAETTNLWVFRDGALARIVLYQETEEALRAAER